MHATIVVETALPTYRYLVTYINGGNLKTLSADLPFPRILDRSDRQKAIEYICKLSDLTKEDLTNVTFQRM